MAEIEGLILEYKTKGVKQTKQDIDRLNSAIRRTEPEVKRASSSMASFAAKIGLAAIAYKGLTSAVKNIRQYERLNAQLKVATGSFDSARKAMSELKDIASETPFQLQEVTTAFIKLKNLGLEPSRQSIISYGNTAASMGKQLDQMIEAVADAAVGEFERLKEFGIKASKQGDDITFTFRGVKTTVQNTSQDIEGYLKGLGENEFGGAMAEQMNTIDGAISNLGDAWFQFTTEFANQSNGIIVPVLKSVENALRKAAKVQSELNMSLSDVLEKGTLDELIDRYMILKNSADDNSEALELLNKRIIEVREQSKGDASDTIANENKKKQARESGLKAVAEAYGSAIKLTADLEGQIKITDQAIVELESKLSDGLSLNTEKDQKELTKLLVKAKELEDELKGKDFARKLSIEEERTQTLVSARDDSQNFSVFSLIENSLSNEEQAILESYDRRKQMILDSTEATETEKAQLIANINKDRLEMERRFQEENLRQREETFNTFQDNLSILAKNGSKKALAVYKAAAIAQTIMDTYKGAQGAFSALAPIPIVGPILGAAAAGVAIAAGLARVNAIRSQSAGNFAEGGFIGGTSTSGDRLTANVNSGEAILNTRQQRNFMRMANDGTSKSQKSVVVNVINNSGQQVTQQRRELNGQDIVDITVGRILSDVASGGNRTSQTFERAYGLQRSSVR